MQTSQKPIPQHLQDCLDWLDIGRGLSSKSQENYARFLKKFFDWLKKNKLQGLKPHELTPDHIWNYRLFLSRGESLKKSTQNYYLIALRSLLSYFTEKDIGSLPSDKVKLAREKEERQVRFLTLEQLEKFFSAPDTSTFHGLRDRAILETLFSTGLRIAELISLNKEQIKIPLGDEELEVSVQGKGGRIRTVYFSQRTLQWLSQYLKARNDNHDALFITYLSEKKKTGTHRMSPRAIQTMFQHYVVKTGIPLSTTPHVMRHTFATDLLTQGVDIRTLQEFLGHKSITATQIYAHVTSQKLREIHQKFHSGKNLK
jgi:site-specific recombinase XerD